MQESDSLDTQVVSSAERFRVVLIVASIVSILFAAPGLLIATKVLWLGAIVLGVDVAIFALMYRLAKRYWVGLLFVPPLAYVAVSTIVTVVAFQLPAYEVITLVK